MSIAVLNQVYDEARRLAIAGSNLAAADFRLKKLVDPLKKSADKTPVFGQVAASIERLVEASAEESAQALLDLSSLVSAILYTQGRTSIDGELQPIETTDVGMPNLQIPATVIKPLIEALTSTGSGRMETVRQAFEQGAFNDLRIIDPAVKALDDSYPDLADFMENRVLPGYGTAVVPLIIDDIDIKGRAGNARRLRTLHRLDPQRARPFVLEAVEQGSKEMKVAALGCLGGSQDDLPYLHEQASSRSKEVRRAAFERLAGFTDDKTIALYAKALRSADIDLVVMPISRNNSAELMELTAAAIKTQTTEVLQSPTKTKNAPTVDRLFTLLTALQGRSDAATLQLLDWLFQQRRAVSKLKTAPVSGSAVIDRLTRVMLESQSPSMHKLLVQHRDEFYEEAFGNCFSAGVDSLSPADAFITFAPYYQETDRTKGTAKQRREALRDVLLYRTGRHGADMIEHFSASPLGIDQVKHGDQPNWAPAWLDAAIAQDDLPVVAALADKATKPLAVYLDKKFANLLKSSARVSDICSVLAVMVRIGHTGTIDCWINAVRKLSKQNSRYILSAVIGLAAELPATDAGKIEAMLPTLPEAVADEIRGQLYAGA